MNFAAGWQAKATTVEENNMGDQVDLPIFREEMQSRRLHKENQPREQLEEVIKGIKRLMLKSAAESVSKKLSRKKPTIAAGENQKKQQQQCNGADGQLQITVWEPSGFQQNLEAHEKELMIFS
jgi:hypothetical protein